MADQADAQNQMVRTARGREIGAWQIDNVTDRVPCSNRGNWTGAVFRALASVAVRRVSDFEAQSLSNTAWAFVIARQSDMELLGVLARAAEQCIDDVAVQALNNTAWAFATAGLSDVQLFTALARKAEKRLVDFSALQLATLA